MYFLKKTLLLLLLLLPNIFWAQNIAFPLPGIPKELKTPEERANYLALHYWDRFDFDSKGFVNDGGVVEQGFVDFISIMPHVSEKDAAFGRLAGNLAMNPEMLDCFMELARRYLTEPESPVRDGELYILFLENIVREQNVPEASLQEAAFELSMAKRNRVGTPANDFKFLARNGKRGSLYKVKGEYTLLFFADPECYLCSVAKRELLAAETVTAMVNEGSLAILCVCPEGETEAWKSAPAPQAWIDACDEKQLIYEKLLYDIPGLPVLYLLDNRKNVLLKDVTVRQVELFLKDNR